MVEVLVRVVVGCLFYSLVAAQDFSIPPTWRKPTSSLSRVNREALASAVVETMSTRFNTSSGQVQDAIYDESAYLLTAIARTDYLSGNTSYQNLVLNNVQAHFQTSPGIANYNGYSPSILAWGLAAINAHLAYNDSQSLPLAISVWDQMIAYQIQPSDAAHGYVVAQGNTTIPAKCNGTSVVGAVFSAAGSAQNTDVNGASVAAFMALSGHLYEVTSDSKYLTAAQLAAQFIQGHMVTGPTITDEFTVGTCQVGAVGPMFWDSGFTIWGLSILATHNGTWTTLLNSLILSGVPFNYWTNPTDGVLTESQGDLTPNSDIQRSLKAVFIRGLQEAWMRADPSSDVATYLKSFLLVQFNALQDLATTPGSNLYSPVWEGPPQPALIEWGQLLALDVLNSAFAVEPKDLTSSVTTSSNLPTSGTSSTSASPTSSSPAPTTSTTPVTRAKSNAGVIAGSTVGAVAGVLILLGLFLFWRRRQTRKQEDLDAYSPCSVTSIDPSIPAPEPYTIGNYEMSEASGGVTGSKYNSPVSRPPMHTEDSAASSADLPLVIAQLNRVLERLPVAPGSAYEPSEVGPPSYRE